MTKAFDLSGHNAQQLREMPYADFLKTGYWKWVAWEVKRRDGFRCRVCNRSNDIAAHHRTYKNHGNEHLHLDDLTTLCEPCHSRHHFPPPPHKVVVKTVVKTVSAPAYFPHGKKERKFFIKAARILGETPEFLCTLGRMSTEIRLSEHNRKKHQQQKDKDDTWPKMDGWFLVGDIASVDRDLPDHDPVTMTKHLLTKCRTNGAFTSATVRALGLDPATIGHGWPKTIIGKTYSREQVRQALRGRHLYAKLSQRQREKFTPA